MARSGKDHFGIALSQFKHASRNSNRKPEKILSLEEQLIKFGTNEERKAAQKSIERKNAIEAAKPVSIYEKREINVW